MQKDLGISKSMSINRFLLAHDGLHPTHQADTYTKAISELSAGRKSTHWMWYVFPQITGLGRSDMAQEFGIVSMSEVVAYITHPTLRDRYLDCSRYVLQHSSQNPIIYDGLKHVLGGIDAGKFRSSITLFGEAARICESLQLDELADTWAKLKALELRPCSKTLKFIKDSPSWCA
jgi:uncharacterized protein (DUF1810 family)